MALLAGAAIAGPIVGGIIGNMASEGQRRAAEAAAAAALKEIDALGAPPDLSKRIILEKFKQAGVYTPQLEQEVNAGFSKVEQIQEDPQLRQRQMEALQALQERSKTGFSAEDRAALNKVRGQVGTDLQGRLGSLQQQMQARGLGGSGAELAAMLSASQAASSEEAAAGDRLAAEASQRALQSALQTGQLGGQLRSQDFDVARAKAEAADRFNLFNAENSMARQARNVASQNQGQLYNLSEQQRSQDINTQMENAERQRMNEATRQYWQDQASRAGMRANARLGQSAMYQGQADRTAQQWAGGGAAIGAGAGTALNYMNRQPTADNSTVKTSVQPIMTGRNNPDEWET